MDLEQFIIEQFHESIAAKMAACEAIAPGIADISELLAHTLLHNGKVLTCGNAESAAVAQQLSLALLHRLERERPALPTFSLNQDSLSLTAIASEQGPSDMYARQIRGLGQPGDVLVILTQETHSSSLTEAIKAAHDRDMTVAIIGGPDLGDIGVILSEDDFEVHTPVEPSPRLTEVHLLAMTCIVELVEAQLFGVEEWEE